MTSKQHLVEIIREREGADGVVVVIFHRGIKAAEMVVASRGDFYLEMPDKLKQGAEQLKEQLDQLKEQFAALDAKVN